VAATCYGGSESDRSLTATPDVLHERGKKGLIWYRPEIITKG
jgi:hypothetical protein